MAIEHEGAVTTATQYAEEAARVAAKLKPGTYEAAQALALVSIAHSLAILADHSRQG